MNQLKHKTEKLLAVALTHDGYVTPYSRERHGSTMKDKTVPKPRKVHASINLVFHIEETSQGLVSLELDCWRPYYPLVTSFYIGFDSDWPFGEGDLPQAGTTTPATPGSRNTFTVNFAANSGVIAWQNSPYASGRLALSTPSLEMMFVTLRIFKSGTAKQARLQIEGFPEGANSFEI